MHSLKFSHSLFLVLKDSPTGLLILRKVLHNKQLHSHNPFRSASNKELLQIFNHIVSFQSLKPYKGRGLLSRDCSVSQFLLACFCEIAPLKVSHSVPEFCHRFAQETLLLGFYRLKYASKLLQQLLGFPPFLTSQTARFSKDFPSKMMK